MGENSQGLRFESFLSKFRWLVILVIGVWINWPGTSEQYHFDTYWANIIWFSMALVSVLYGIAAKELKKDKVLANKICKFGIILDIILISAIIIYAAPAINPFFGFYYLIVLCAAGYWGKGGSIITATSITVVYLVGLSLNYSEVHHSTYINAAFKFILLYAVGFLGGEIIENEHSEKKLLVAKEQEVLNLLEKFKGLSKGITEVSEELESHSVSIFKVSKDCDKIALKIAQINNNVASESLVHTSNIKTLSENIAKSHASIENLVKTIGTIEKNSKKVLKGAETGVKSIEEAVGSLKGKAKEDNVIYKEAVENANNQLKDISSAVKKIVKELSSIGESLKEVDAAADIVGENACQVLGLSEHITESVQEVAASSIEQSEIATNLVKLSQELHKLSEKRTMLSQIIEKNE